MQNHMDGWWLWAARDYHKHLGNRADDHLDDWKYLGHTQVGLIKNWSHLESDSLMEDDQCSKWQVSVCHITLWGSRICSHARLVVLEDTLHLWTHQAHRMTQYTDGRWQVLKVTITSGSRICCHVGSAAVEYTMLCLWLIESSVVCLNILWWEEQEWTNIEIAHVICLEAES